MLVYNVFNGCLGFNKQNLQERFMLMPICNVNGPPLAKLLALAGEAVSLFMSRCKTPSECEYVRVLIV